VPVETVNEVADELMPDVITDWALFAAKRVIAIYPPDFRQ
jgi:hypothetical protein